MEVVDFFDDSAVRSAAYIAKFESVSFDNDTNNPDNHTFVKHCDSKSIIGVRRSYIDGPELVVHDNSQTIMNCTQDLLEIVCDCELETWNVPYMTHNNLDFILRAVIVSLSHINKNK